MEGQNAKKTGKLEEASIQHLIDCATGQYDNDGCLGGLTETGFDFVQDNGINSYSDYPYEAVNSTCRSKDKAILKTQGEIFYDFVVAPHTVDNFLISFFN